MEKARKDWEELNRRYVDPENSMKQANDNHQAWKDRHDVDKVFAEWDDGILSFPMSESSLYTERQVKSFAVFFAERVKCAPLESKTKE